MHTASPRRADHPIDAQFLDRWSPRAFDASTLSEQDLLTMLEAGRWAASSYNVQPWRFVWARRDTPHWPAFLDLLVEFNQSWAKNASALIYLFSNSMMRPPGSEADVPSRTHSLDAGTASGYVALQASRMGWYAHGMIGFDTERAAVELRAPAGYRVEAAYAIGRLGDPATLPPALQSRESPSSRLPLDKLAFEGAFPTN